jgi:hypothetical protein
MTSSPRLSASSKAKFEPTKPAPPVINIRMVPRQADDL